MSDTRILYPLSDLLEASEFPLINFLPSDTLSDLFSSIYFTEATTWQTDDNQIMDVNLVMEGELSLSPPGTDFISIVLNSGVTGWTDINLRFVLGTNTSCEILGVSAVIRVQLSILEDIATGLGSEITFSGDIAFTTDGIEILEVEGGNLAPAYLCNTVIIVEAINVLPCFNAVEPPTYLLDQDEFQGVAIEQLSLTIPVESIESGGAIIIQLEDAAIGTTGFTGSVSITAGDIGSSNSCTLLGFEFSLVSFSLDICQNAIIEATIEGDLTIPFWNKILSIELTLGVNGVFLITVGTDGVISPIETDYYTLTLTSLAIGKDDDKFYLEFSGTLLIKEVLGVQLPEISVDGLRVYSDGSVSIEGGSITLEQQQIIDLYGFQMEIDSVGFGTGDGEIDEDGSVGPSGPFVSFSGGVKLTDALPLGVSANGLRYWFDSNKITLEGIGVSFEIPNTLSFSGYVDLDTTNEEFAGAIKLQLLPVNLEIDARLVVGTYDDQKYFYISLDAELPFGVPIGATGLAFYGFAGMIENNMAPVEVKNDEGETDWRKWFDDYYKADDPSSGWKYQANGFGMGVGTTIGTLPDNGFTLSTKVGFMVLFPGPVIMIQGVGNLLRKRSQLDDNPLFDSLIVFDGNAKTLLASLEMNYLLPNGTSKEGIILDASGTAEGFFDFDNINNWHIYLGEEDEDKRIKAEILNRIFKAESFLMLDPDWLRAGAYVGFEKEYEFKVAKVYFSAWIYGKAGISWAPQQLEGELGFEGEVGLSVCNIDFGLSVDASVGGEIPTPQKFFVDYKIEVDLPKPLKNIEIDGELSWEEDGEPEPVPGIIQESHIRDYKTTDSWKIELNDSGDYNNGDSVSVDDVPLDARPIIVFDRNLKDSTGAGTPTPNPEDEKVGDTTFSYALKLLELQKWEGDDWGKPIEIKGSWQATGDEGGTEIELQGDGPFSFTRETITSKSEEAAETQISSYLDSFLSTFGTEYFPFSIRDIEWLIFAEHNSEGNLGSEFEIDRIIIRGFNKLKRSDLYLQGFVYNNYTLYGVELSSEKPVHDAKENSTNKIIVEFPEPAYLYAVLMYTVQGCKYKGELVFDDGSTEKIPSSSEPDGWFYLQVQKQNVKSVILTITENTCYLYSVLYSYEYWRLKKEASRICSESRYLYEPESVYRISIGTETYKNDALHSAETKYGFFETGGPPDDLTPYVSSVIFSNNANPHYCLYDVQIQFNENYVANMYNGLLKLEIYDQNDICLTGATKTTTGKGEIKRDYYLDAWYETIKEVVEDVNCEGDAAADDFLLASLYTALPQKQLLELRLEYEGDRLWSVPFITSGYNDFTSLINDFQIDPWVEELASGSTLDFSIGEDFEKIFYDKLLLNSGNLPDKPELIVLRDSSAKIKVVVMKLTEPVEWARTNLIIDELKLMSDGSFEIAETIDYRVVQSSDNTRFIFFREGVTEVATWNNGYYRFSFEYFFKKVGMPTLSKSGSIFSSEAEEVEKVSMEFLFQT